MDALLNEPRRGWLFAEDFDTRTTVSAPEPEPEFIEPVYSLADLDAARAAAAAAARHAALAEAARHDAATAAALCARIATALDDAAMRAQAIAEDVARPLAGAILAALRAALPALFAHHGAEEVAALVARIVPALRSVPRATISLDPRSLAALANLPELSDIDPERLCLREDPSMTPGEIAIAWDDGGIRRDLASLLAEIDGVLGLAGLLEGTHGR
jgi:flagellar biosynthesis/type III secretory pathway protein FliH